jgi:3-hydroxyisobutyrate dehydrogenase-like beta-hydroxyacid dehydrogenase
MVFCCVGNDDDLRSVVLGDDGAFAGMEPGAIFVDHTTASAEVARELYAEAASAACTSSTPRYRAVRPVRSTASSP